jgi:hypothetical protein
MSAASGRAAQGIGQRLLTHHLFAKWQVGRAEALSKR